MSQGRIVKGPTQRKQKEKQRGKKGRKEGRNRLIAARFRRTRRSSRGLGIDLGLLLQEVGPQFGEGLFPAGAVTVGVVVAVDARSAGGAMVRRERCPEAVAVAGRSRSCEAGLFALLYIRTDQIGSDQIKTYRMEAQLARWLGRTTGEKPFIDWVSAYRRSSSEVRRSAVALGTSSGRLGRGPGIGESGW